MMLPENGGVLVIALYGAMLINALAFAYACIRKGGAR